MGGLEAGKFSDPQGGVRSVTVLQVTCDYYVRAHVTFREQINVSFKIDWLVDWAVSMERDPEIRLPARHWLRNGDQF